jgi:hypothetical protein
MSPNLVRLSGLAAILRGVQGVLLTPVLAYLWATDSDKYGYFGRAYFLVFLGCLSGLAGLYGGRTSCPVYGLLLIAAGPAGLVLSVPHIPGGTMLLFCCAWVVPGYLLLMGKVPSAK